VEREGVNIFVLLSSLLSKVEENIFIKILSILRLMTQMKDHKILCHMTD